MCTVGIGCVLIIAVVGFLAGVVGAKVGYDKMDKAQAETKK